MHLGRRALDYPEYDLVGVVTGNEGTLSAITQIDARLVHIPPSIKTMTAAFDSIAQAGQAVSAVIAAGLIPATLEMMDQKIMRFIEDLAHPGLPVDAGAMLIVEVDSYPDSLDSQISEIANILRRNGARDLRIAQTEQERETLWFGRKSAGGAYPHLTVDSTVPRSRIAEMLDAANRICERHAVRVGHVFHAGDGNLHPSMMMDEHDSQQVAAVLRAALLEMGPFLLDVASGLITSIAEIDDANRAKQWLEELRRTALGIGGYAVVTAMPEEWNGVVDRWDYHPESLNLMRALKARWDPAGILGVDTFVVE